MQDALGETMSPEVLVSPYGVVSRAYEVSGGWAPAELTSSASSVGSCCPGRGDAGGVLCGGHAWQSQETARLIAIVEAAERYSAGDFRNETRIWATAGELPGPVLDPARYPRCTPDEYAHPQCPVRPFDPSASIRWVRGLDLLTQQPTWLPACMATYFLDHPGPAERFAVGISTGYAAHVDAAEAILGGLMEVAERDANAVLWLQRLPLPPVDAEILTAKTRAVIEWSRVRFVDTYLFDATTDIGIPTAYCLLSAEHDDKARRVVGSSAGRTLAEAAESAVFETVRSRVIFHENQPVPADYASFALMDGARYMGTPERAGAFDFLLDGLDRRRPSRGTGHELPADPAAALTEAVARLNRHGMQAVAVDRTTLELELAGLTAVNVVIPDLQPMSLRPLAQFRAHPRLFRAPAAMGYRVLDEQELNPWPQPFA